VIAATGIEALVIEDITCRQAVGINKYGMTVADNPLAISAWLQHAYEELLDGAIYMKRAMSSLHEDGGTAALLWVLWHHQGASSTVGQPIRFALGMDRHQRMSDAQIELAKRWVSIADLPKTPSQVNIDGGGRNELFEGYFDGEDDKARMTRLAEAALNLTRVQTEAPT
jgi:hypothetical protein